MLGALRRGLGAVVKSGLRFSVAVNAGIKVLALVVSLVSTPLMMRFFSNDAVLGAWFTVLSVLNWISFFDFGIGNGLRNDLTYALSEGDGERARVVISSSIFVLGAVVVALIPLGAAASALVDWNSALSVEQGELDGGDLAACMAVVIVGTLLQLVLKLVNSLLYAVQRNATPALLLLVSNCLVLLAVAFPPTLAGSGEKFIYMCVVEMVALSVPLAFAAFALFATELRPYAPRLKNVRSGYFRNLGALGLKFFLIQIALLFVSSTNELFIGLLCGSEGVVPYSVAYRVLNLVLVFFGVMAQPIWSDMASSFAVGDRFRLLSVHRKYLALAVIASVGTFVIGMLINPILGIWLGGQAPTLTIAESVSLVFLVVVTVLTNSETCLGNATNRLGPQIVGYCLGAIVKYPLSVALSAIAPGWASVVFANGLVLVPVLIAQHIANRWLTAGSEEVSNESK